jgi:hypothetical protein
MIKGAGMTEESIHLQHLFSARNGDGRIKALSPQAAKVAVF